MRLTFTLCVALISTALSACGGGGGGGDSAGDGGANSGSDFSVIFEDDFGVFPSPKWTISSVFLGSALGVATLDLGVGAQAVPALRLEGNVQVSAFGGAFPTAGGLQIYVRVRLPSDTDVCGGGLDARIAPLFELRDASTNRRTALIEVWRNACDAGDTTEIRYTLWPEPNESSRPINATLERLGPGSVNGTEFWDFSFIMFSSGNVSLRRNGVTRVVSSPPYAPTHVTLALAGFSPRFSGRTLAPVSVHYDDVVVVKPN